MKDLDFEMMLMYLFLSLSVFCCFRFYVSVYVSAFEAGDATGAVTEAGIFNAASGGDMLCRTVFSVVNKAADDTMSVTWTITLSAS